MKYCLYLILFFFNLNLAAQIPSPEIVDPLDRAISEFRKPIGAQDFEAAIALLKDLKAQYPDSTEIRYFLGYAYDRLNSNDGRMILDYQMELAELASQEFEFVVRHEPKYSKRKLILDPYSKLTAIWGSLALKYYYHNDLDSTKLAFTEGKKRGGFSDGILEICAKILDSCSPNAILFASGDNFTFPILYKQIVEDYRSDVQVIDIALINAEWYGELLQYRTSIPFLKEDIDFANIPDFVESTPEVITITNEKCPTEGDFDWEIKQLRNGKYLTKGDVILKAIISQNKFQHDVYFTLGQNLNDLLSLDAYFSWNVFVSQLNPCKSETIKTDNIQFSEATLTNATTQNSSDLLFAFDLLRYNYLLEISEKSVVLDAASTNAMLDEMERIFPRNYLPIQNEGISRYLDSLRK